MTKLASVLKGAAILAVGLALAPAAMAQATRTWVSGVGDDVNPCSRTAPCKTWAGAISKTAAGGEIDALDPGGFGALTITKSITIDGGGVLASVLAAGTNGILISSSTPTGARIVLRNLSIQGVGESTSPGWVGVNILAPGVFVSIERCRIAGFTASSATGIRATQAAQLFVKDTVIANNGIGMHLEPPSGYLVATLDNVLIEDSASYGLQAAGLGTAWVTVKHSSIHNSMLHAVNAAGPGSVIAITDSSLSFNWGYAVNVAYPGARVSLSGNTIVNNSNTFAIASGGILASDGTNRIAGTLAASPNATFTNQ
jgi:hypothetical protein